MPEAEGEPVKVRTFWQWLFKRDAQGDFGFNNLVDWQNLLGLVVSLATALLANHSAANISSGLALPIAAVLIAVSFAWAGRSTSLLQDKEFSEFIIENGAPPEGYLYSFQLAIGVALISLIVSASIANKIFLGTTGSLYVDEAINRFFLVFSSWIAARECWGVISFSNKLAIQFYEVRRRKLAQQNKS